MSPAPTVPWDEIHEEALRYLSEYLRIDTTNPPGNEAAAAEYLKDILEKEGVEVSVFSSADGRANILARLRGTGKKRPICLLGHSDVVPVEREHWQHDPFGGEVIDGTLWGRGTLDMKGMGVMELLTLLTLKRHNVELDRDILYLQVADEEVGGKYGMDWMAEHHPEVLDVEYVLNEGAFGMTEIMGQPTKVFMCSPSEKGPVWVRLRSHGRPGHGSMPHDDNPMDRLVEALGRVKSWDRDIHVLPEMQEFFKRLHQSGHMPEITDEAAYRNIANMSAPVRAMMSNTISLTNYHGGKATNVIPGACHAELDCRLLPNQSKDDFLKELEDVIADAKIDVEVIQARAGSQSNVEDPIMQVIEDVINEKHEDAIVLPIVSPGYTDSRVFREHGVQAFGFIPIMLTNDELAGIHGHNERISLENLRVGTETIFEVVYRVAGAAAG